MQNTIRCWEIFIAGKEIVCLRYDVKPLRIFPGFERAFGQAVEADIVDRLRQACPETLSVVREDAGCVVGHSG